MTRQDHCVSGLFVMVVRGGKAINGESRAYMSRTQVGMIAKTRLSIMHCRGQVLQLTVVKCTRRRSPEACLRAVMAVTISQLETAAMAITPPTQ